jgi:transposase
MARPSKLTDEVEARICDALRLGYPHEAAAAAAGITARTYYSWKSKGEKGDGDRYVQFLHAAKKAEAEGEGALVLDVRKWAAKDWRAAMTLLERRWPERWARRIMRPEDGPTEHISVTFNIPPPDPAAKGDDLVVNQVGADVESGDDDGGNGK